MSKKIEPTEHDIIFCRGGGGNHHKGNRLMRDMIRACQLDCLIGFNNDPDRLTKPKEVAKTILSSLRELDPPTRFLTKPDIPGSHKKRKRGSTIKKAESVDSPNRSAPPPASPADGEQDGWVEELDDGVILNKLMQQLRDGAPSIRKCIKYCFRGDPSAFREYFEDPENLEQTKRPYRCPNCEKMEF